MNKKKSVFEHLKSGRTITSLEAFNLYKTLRLSAIIFSLKEEGRKSNTYDIESTMVKKGDCNVAEYRMVIVQPMGNIKGLASLNSLRNEKEIQPIMGFATRKDI